MAGIKRINDEVFVVGTDKGKINMSWGDLCDISRFVTEVETFEEVEDYIGGFGDEEFEKRFGVSPDRIWNDAEIRSQIADGVIQIRINNETTDEVYEALEVVLADIDE